MSYQDFWDRQSETIEAAIRAVDGSGDESIVRQTGKWTAEQMRYALDLQAGDRVLELGCGVGRIGRELAPHCGEWVGSDISPNMLKGAQARLADLNNVQLQQLERSSFEGIFADNAFDKAYSVAVFCHIDKEDLFLYLQDLFRILRPGGLLYVETWNLAHAVGWRRWELEVNHWRGFTAAHRKDAGRNQFCHPAEFELYARQAGFDVLARYDQSPWVQIVAAKQPNAEQRASVKAHLHQHESRIAYSETFSQCFEKTMQLATGEVPIEEVHAFLDSIAGTPEAALFRPYLDAMTPTG